MSPKTFLHLVYNQDIYFNNMLNFLVMLCSGTAFVSKCMKQYSEFTAE